MMDTQSSHTQFTPEERIHSLPLLPPTPPCCTAASHNSTSSVSCWNYIITPLQVVTSFYVLVFFSSYLDLPFLHCHIWMSRFFAYLFFPGIVFCNISVFSCCSLFALSQFFPIYHSSWHSVESITFTHSLAVMCLCHTLHCSDFFHSWYYHHCNPEQHSFESPFSLKIICHDNG